MNIQMYKTKLEEEKALLIEELGALGKVDKKGDWEATPESETLSQEVPDDGDMAERAEDYEERSSKLSALESRLNDINHALSLIDGDQYGKCEMCGMEIEEERLSVNPSARKCEVCMNKIG